MDSGGLLRCSALDGMRGVMQTRMGRGQRLNFFWGIIHVHLLRLCRYLYLQMKEFTNLAPLWVLNAIFIKMLIQLYI